MDRDEYGLSARDRSHEESEREDLFGIGSFTVDVFDAYRARIDELMRANAQMSTELTFIVQSIRAAVRTWATWKPEGTKAEKLSRAMRNGMKLGFAAAAASLAGFIQTMLVPDHEPAPPTERGDS